MRVCLSSCLPLFPLASLSSVSLNFHISISFFPSQLLSILCRSSLHIICISSGQWTKRFFPFRQDICRKSKGGMKKSDLGHIPVWRVALACVRPKWGCVHAQPGVEMSVYLSVTSPCHPNPRKKRPLHLMASGNCGIREIFAVVCNCTLHNAQQWSSDAAAAVAWVWVKEWCKCCLLQLF